MTCIGVKASLDVHDSFADIRHGLVLGGKVIMTYPLKTSPDLMREYRDHERIQERVWAWPGRGIEMKRSSLSYGRSRFILGKSLKADEAARKEGITDQTYYRWRKEYGGLKIDQARRLKELEKENARLKKLLAESHLDRAMLREVVSGNF